MMKFCHCKKDKLTIIYNWKRFVWNIGHELDYGEVIITLFWKYSIEIFFISWCINQDRIKNAYLKLVKLIFMLCEYSVKWEVCRKISLWSTVWLVSLDLPGALKNKIKSLKAIKAIKAIGFPKLQQIEFCCWKKETYKGLLEGQYKCNCRCPDILRCISMKKIACQKLAMGRPLYCQPAPLSICQPQSSSQNRKPQTSILWFHLMRFFSVYISV